MSNNPFFDKIEAYLEDSLSEDDRFAFIEELSQNKALQDKLRKHQLAYSVIEKSIENSLRDKLNELKEKEKAGEEILSNPLKKYVPWFIGALVILVILYFLLKK